jgi:hypothetical protein
MEGQVSLLFFSVFLSFFFASFTYFFIYSSKKVSDIEKISELKKYHI